jgi:proline iminopeptidase
MRRLMFLLQLTILPFPANAQEKHIKTSDGVDLYVKVKGKGTPCLYIHGGPGSGSYWLEKFSGEMLEKHFQMIYLDQRGVCRSSSPDDSNYSIDRMIKDFEEVRKALGIKEWLTLGHSFGGVLQVGYAERYPEIIKGMMMINCGLNINECLEEAAPKACEILGITDIKPYTDRSIPFSDRRKKILELYGILREKDLFWKMGYAEYHNVEMMNESFNDIPKWNKDFENISMTIEEYWSDYKKHINVSMQMPVLFFYGKTDWMIGPNHYKSVYFPNMILWESNVGHIPFIENKTDLENAIKSYQKKFKLFKIIDSQSILKTKKYNL